MFLGTTLPILDLQGLVTKATIGPFVVEKIDWYKIEG